jgi:endonuclease YncB( thermonuclease family)
VVLGEFAKIAERAPRRGALFVWLIVGWVLLAPPAQALDCPAERVDEQVVVAKVVDGDTVRLADKRVIRLIGINTPEIGYDGRPSEPLAEAAREALISLIGASGRVGLRHGADRLDRHRRHLAHLYLPDGRSVAAQLLTQGLAAQVVVSPNLWGVDCYHRAEAEARAARRGVWASFYTPVPVDELPRDSRGFRVISGRVERVGESKKSLWLNFTRLPGEGRREGVALRISRDELGYFRDWDPRELQGKRIVVRGWLARHQRQLVMRLYHPAALEILP